MMNTQKSFNHSFENYMNVGIVLLICGAVASLFQLANNTYITPENMTSQVFALIIIYLTFIGILFAGANLMAFVKNRDD